MINTKTTSLVDSSSHPAAPPTIRQVQGTALNLLSLEQAGLAFGRMIPVKVEVGEEVIQQGDTGEHYFFLESGEAEVWRTDPMTDETSMVAVLGPGSVFGEEALLLDGCRNASVRMLTQGRIWTLFKTDFDTLVRPELVDTIQANEAKAMVAIGEAQWLDCRYEMEYSEHHIPGAYHLPLDQLRNQTKQLDPDKTHIVYCRSGRRSAAAAYLLRERGFKAYSLQGGIIDYPQAN